MISEGVLPAAHPGATPAGAAAPGERVVRPEFTGSAAEYFRVWIVNLFFTLITLGIYSPWAKVRKKRYFYGCTRLDGDTFDYLGSPKVILKGRIVAVLLFVIYAFCVEIYPLSKLAFVALFVLALPWLVVRSLSFNARNSAYRGLRFNFTATPREAVRFYVGMPIIVGLTLGIAYPWFVARNKAFVVSHHAFGTTDFGCELRARDFYRTYVLAVLLTIFGVAPIGALAGYSTYSIQYPEALEWARYVVPVLPIYAGYLLVYAFVQARTANLLWNGAYGPGVHFTSTLQAGKLANLYIGNVLAAAATAGMLIPWAAVRTLRYRLENFAMTVERESVHEADPALERVGATGQEFGDIFNLDLGL
jgi:uncharacterized membrane protein YjgN (DUF898 family)